MEIWIFFYFLCFVFFFNFFCHLPQLHSPTSFRFPSVCSYISLFFLSFWSFLLLYSIFYWSSFQCLFEKKERKIAFTFILFSHGITRSAYLLDDSRPLACDKTMVSQLKVVFLKICWVKWEWWWAMVAYNICMSLKLCNQPCVCWFFRLGN